MFVFEIFTAKLDKMAETRKHLTTDFYELQKKKPELLEKLKNYTVYQQMIGPYGKFYMVWEAESFEDYQTIMSNMIGDEDMRKYLGGWSGLLVDGLMSIELLNKIT